MRNRYIIILTYSMHAKSTMILYFIYMHIHYFELFLLIVKRMTLVLFAECSDKVITITLVAGISTFTLQQIYTRLQSININPMEINSISYYSLCCCNLHRFLIYFSLLEINLIFCILNPVFITFKLLFILILQIQTETVNLI